MDVPEGDPFADLDTEMNAVGDSPPDAEMPLPDAEMPLPVAVPVPVPVAPPPPPLSLFNYGAAPPPPVILLESKYGNIVPIPKTNYVNDRINASEFSVLAMDFERHGSPAGLKYAQWFFVEFDKEEMVDASLRTLGRALV